MTAWPDAAVLAAFLARARRRLTLLGAMDAASMGVVAAALAVMAGWIGDWPRPVVLSVAPSTAGLVLAIALRRAARLARQAPAAIERQAPACANVVFTAAEILDAPERVKPEIGALVCRHAGAAVRRLEVAALFPAGRAVVRLTAAVVASSLLVVTVAGRRAPDLLRGGGIAGASEAATIGRIEITITPPPYTRLPVTSQRDPASVTAVSGSRLRVRAASNAAAVTLETVESRQALSRDDSGEFAGEVVVTRDGFLAVQAVASSGAAGPRRLIGVGIQEDRAPVVRIARPGRDLFLTTAGTGLPIEVTAEDDLALASLRVTFTTVSGTGEDFTFKEGEVPLQVSRESDRRWIGSATWSIAALRLSPGDMVVYRGVAADLRPGAPPVESDAFLVQIVTPDRAPAGGFILDDDSNKYAISQQMIILKTEQLIARRASLSPAAVADEAAAIASDQRRVRAEFIFMMGGELEDLQASADQLDETEEAARESELAEGRLQNRGRLDLIQATRFMSRAALALALPDLARALPAEKSALVLLQRAFAQSRYLLRPLSTQQQLDLTRRLGGRFADLSRDPRPAATPIESPRLTALRRALAGVAALSASAAPGADDADRATAIAESILRADAARPGLREVAAALTNAASDLRRGDRADAKAQIDRAALDLSGEIRAGLHDAPMTPARDLDRLRGAVADALGRKGGQR